MNSFSIWHWLILAAVVYALWRIVRRSKARTEQSPTTRAAPGGSIAKIRGNGRFEVEVVGESFYTASFIELARRHRPQDSEDESFGDAVLTLEDGNPHDSNAVAVHIEGLQVGYLSRGMAKDFRHSIVRDGLAKHRQFAVAARLYWGGDDGLQSVSLDIPQA